MSLSDTLNAINKAMGIGTVIMMSDKPLSNVSVISTTCCVLDRILGVGGIPRGRITEISGPESSGKTTICLHLIAQAQKMGLKCAIIDTEHSLDVQYAQNLGVNVEELIFCQPEYAEIGLEVATQLADSKEVGLIIIDSIAGLLPKAEMEGSMEDQQMGLVPRILNKYLRKNTGIIRENNVALVVTNQLRDKIGQSFGEQTTTVGGRGLRHDASIRLKVIRLETEKDKSSGEKSGSLTKVICNKNKVAPPFKECTFSIIFGKGIDNFGCIVDLAVDLDIIKKAGAWYTYSGGTNNGRWQGRNTVIAELKENDGLLIEINKEIELKLKVE